MIGHHTRLSVGPALVVCLAAIGVAAIMPCGTYGWATEDALSTNSRLTPDGIGPVKIGMTVEEVRSMIGPIEDDNTKDQSCYFITPLRGPRGITFMIIDNRVARVDVIENSPILTDRGIGIGVSEAQIKKAYGENVEIGPHFYTDGHYVRVSAPESKRLMLFETENGLIDTYRAGESYAVNFVEGCL